MRLLAAAGRAALVLSTAPKAPKSTLASERFMASHMILVRMIPDAPTREPLITRPLLPSTKPVAQAARPE